MDMKHLHYFLTLAQEGNFSRAAEILNISQPALSISIKKLEEELGVALFYSFDRKQHLTDEGLRLLKGARELSDIYQKTVEDVRHTDSYSTGEFTFGLSPLFGACFFGDLIPGFSAAYPNIKINMIEDGANRIDQRIENGTVDIAVTLKTEQLSSFSSCHFSTQRNVALLHKSHPLANRAALTVSDLKDDAFAIFNSDFILHRQIMSACHTAGFRPKIALLSSQWDFMVELVSRNRAVSILPKPVLDRHPDPNICCVPLTDSMKYWDISLAWNPRKYMPKPCCTFLNYIKQNLPPDDL
jgi:DNA-binding transcriptional LysR family regulator